MKKLWTAALALLCLTVLVSCQRTGPAADASSSQGQDPVLAGDQGPAPDSEPVSEPGTGPESGSASEPDPGPEVSSALEPEPVPEPVPEPEPEPPAPKNTKLYILMYHDFVPGDGTGCNNWTLPASRFWEDLQWLSDHGYTTVLPSELAAGEPLPERAVMLTFDDGYVSNYTLAYPILREFGAKAVISLITGPIAAGDTRYLTWDMCREMADSGLVELGSHTHTLHFGEHVNILRDEGEGQGEYMSRVFADVWTSVYLIQFYTGAEVHFFAYPGGKVDQWSDSFIHEIFSVTVTTRSGPADIAQGLYKLRRCNISLAEGVSKFLPA